MIIGAGLAGCAVAGALASHGIRCTIIDSLGGLAQGTSSVPVAIFKPHTSSKPSFESDFINRCYERLLTELDALGIQPTVSGLHQAVARSSDYEHSAHWHKGKTAHFTRPTESVFAANAGALSPLTLCRRWVQHPLIQCIFNKEIVDIEQHRVGHENSWTVFDKSRTAVTEGQILVFANALSANRFASHPAYVPVSGHLSLFSAPTSGPVLCNNGYVIPTPSGSWCGATFHRGHDTVRDQAKDNADNFERWRDLISNQHRSPLLSWSGVRCTTTDRLPVAGGVPDYDHYRACYQDLHHGKVNKRYPPAQYRNGLYILTGLGSRGVTQALYCAEILAEIILGKSATDRTILNAVHPARFLIRQLRKTPGVSNLA